MAIFDGNRCLSRNGCTIGRWLLRNVNWKSWVHCRIEWMVSFLMTLSDSSPGFQGHYTYKSNISKTVRFKDKVTKEH